MPQIASRALQIAMASWFVFHLIAQTAREPVDSVDPNIGGIGNLLTATSPTVMLPHAMMQVAPITTPGITDRYLADKIYGFPAGGVVLMPLVGAVSADPAGRASAYDHGLETATPYYYAATLEKHNIDVDYTVSERAAYYRIAFPDGAAGTVLFTVRGGGRIERLGPAAIAGQDGGAPGDPYFYAELSITPVSAHAIERLQVATRDRRQVGGTGVGFAAGFQTHAGERVGLRIGMSFISVDQARQNLEREIPRWDFEAAKAQARDVWNRELGKIAVKGGTEAERRIFYTGLYRTMSKPVNTAEGDRYYSVADRKVHPAGGHGFYASSGGLWGSYRSQHPLQLLLAPQRQVDFVRSYLNLYDQSGHLMGSGRSAMIGHHVAALILDTYVKGYRDFDVVKAYQGMKKNAMEETMLPWKDIPLTSLDRVYLEKGFFPALAKGEQENVAEVHSFERRQAVSVTLEAAYDDWCTAQIAKVVGNEADYELFMKRARNYANVFDPRVGFMAPKSADGKWVLDPAEFSPIWSGGQGGREYYTEMNSWIWTFHVQHDVAGLIQLIGGREAFTAKLDRLFTEQFGRYPYGDKGTATGTKYFFLSWFPDQTGLIGQYAQGNEPSFHIPYLYNYAGEPWKAQRRLREIMKIWFDDTPRGISGDDDRGEESSWYVFSAMGFYPVCPGRPVYDIGSPLFDEVKLTLANGKTFTITAQNISERNKYIQSAELNGKPLNRPWFTHEDIVNGGALLLRMGPRANAAWGSAPDAAPPSMSR
jgi:predicted alpha-1,2-mannosidase